MDGPRLGTLHPVWNQTFEFSVRNAIRMHFRVYDHDLFTMHDICGDADLDLIAEDVGDAHYHDVVLGLDPQVRPLPPSALVSLSRG